MEIGEPKKIIEVPLPEPQPLWEPTEEPLEEPVEERCQVHCLWFSPREESE